MRSTIMKRRLNITVKPILKVNIVHMIMNRAKKIEKLNYPDKRVEQVF